MTLVYVEGLPNPDSLLDLDEFVQPDDLNFVIEDLPRFPRQRRPRTDLGGSPLEATA